MSAEASQGSRLAFSAFHRPPKASQYPSYGVDAARPLPRFKIFHGSDIYSVLRFDAGDKDLSLLRSCTSVRLCGGQDGSGCISRHQAMATSRRTLAAIVAENVCGASPAVLYVNSPRTHGRFSALDTIFSISSCLLERLSSSITACASLRLVWVPGWRSLVRSKRL